MEQIFKKFLSTDNNSDELEVRFGLKNPITRIDYDNIIQKLKSLGFKEK